MAVTQKHDSESPPAAVVEAIEEIMAIYRSLPPRPSIEEFEAAESVLRTVDLEEKAGLGELSKMDLSKDIPEDLCGVVREVKRTLVLFRSLEQRKEAAFLVEKVRLFCTFDGLIRRANGVVSGEDEEETSVQRLKDDDPDGETDAEGFRGSSTKKTASILKGDAKKLTLMKVAALIERSFRNKSSALYLKGKLMDHVEWLPISIGKLTEVTELDLSENRIMALPNSIGAMRALTKLDIHSNQIINLPQETGQLVKLKDLDCHGNRLRSLPASFGKLTSLVNLDLSSNGYSQLPDSIGSLTSLERLNVESNELEELPYVIGSCSSLVELRLDFNNLKALPESIGKLKSLQILTMYLNRIKGLPTTICNLSNLRELNVGFNELESIPESLSSAVNLVKLNVGKNFADLQALPRSIGDLKMLEELDISNDQIRTLPDSFGLLSRLRVFRADETPLELPPREIANSGAQAVVEYMSDYVAKRDAVPQPSKKKRKGLWFSYSCLMRACQLCCS